MLKKLISLATAIAVLGIVAGAQASTLYDFNGLTPGIALNGNGGWTCTGGTDVATASNTAAEGWLGTGVYAQAGDSGGTAATYELTNDFNWLVDNRDFDVSVLSYDTTAKGDFGVVALQPLPNDGAKQLLFGVGEDQYQAHTLKFWTGAIWNSGIVGSWQAYSLPTFTAPKTLRVGCHFTAKGGGVYEMQRYYINMSDDPTTVVNIGTPYTSQVIPDIGAVWGAGRYLLYLNKTGKVDDIRIDQVPEPSTLVLLAGGLLGLLAYAWRKRK